MLDCPLLACGALGVSGAGLALAAWSQSAWWASLHRAPLRDALGRSAFVAPFSFGLALLAGALAWSAGEAWQRLVWGALGAALIIVFVRSLRS